VYACICHAVTETELTSVISGGATTPEAVGRACGAGTGCGSCLERVCARLGAPALPSQRVQQPVMAAS
jgi:bacterioferritin-associated ferredoxin